MRMTSIPPCLAVVAVTALMLTACGSSSATVGSPTTQASAGASARTTGSNSTIPSTAAGVPAVVVCTALPISQVGSLSGVAVTSSREQDFAAGNAYTCDYFPASGTGGLSVTVTTVGGAQAYGNTLQTDTVAGAAENVTPLTGVGDKAFSAHDGVRAVFGDRMIYVAGLASDPPAVAIIQALQAKLG
jgi:hypothetical protein